MDVLKIEAKNESDLIAQMKEYRKTIDDSLKLVAENIKRQEALKHSSYLTPKQNIYASTTMTTTPDFYSYKTPHTQYSRPDTSLILSNNTSSKNTTNTNSNSEINFHPFTNDQKLIKHNNIISRLYKKIRRQ